MPAKKEPKASADLPAQACGGVCWGVACLSRLWACSARRDGQPQCYGQNPTISELEKIVGGADKSPLGAHLFEAAQQELAESTTLKTPVGRFAPPP